MLFRLSSVRSVDTAFFGISIGAAYLLEAHELVFMTTVCLVNHGLASFLRAHPGILLNHQSWNLQQSSSSLSSAAEEKKPKVVSSLSASQREINMKIRKVLGLACFAVALACLEYYDKLLFILLPEQTAESLSLLISLAFIVFDHIYSVFFCEPPPRSAWAVSEDLLTATAMLSVLSSSTPTKSSTSSLTSIIRLWLVYKILMPLFISSLKQQPSPSMKKNRSELPVGKKSASTKAKAPSNSSSSMMKSQHQQNTNDIDNNVQKTILWEINGTYYDLADFVHRHPGGKEALLLGRGRNCTALVASYHPFSEQQFQQVLEKYRTNSSSNSSLKQLKQQAQPPQQSQDYFYHLLCQRVEKVLKEKGIDPIQDRGATFGRSTYYVVIAIALCISGYFHAKGSILGSFLFGVFGWLIGALGHDAGHFSASRLAWVNDFGVWGMSLLSNPIVWQHQHTYAHHSFTNDFDHDPDLHHFHALIRVHKRFKHHSIYQQQNKLWFVILAYSLVVFGTCFWIPVGMIRDGSLYGIVEWTDRNRRLRSAAMFLHVVCYAGFIVVLPFWTMPWYRALAAVIVHLATSGLSFAFFSQINHLNEASLMDDATRAKREASRRDARLSKSWAVEQVETSNNFCTNSFAWHILSNGLNLQIEHHLFPGLNHCHLHHIAPVVRETCLEYGVCYKEYNGWIDIFNATLNWLDKLADEDGATSGRKVKNERN
eukprot:CAMPEP_0198152034 /NCGR_PEP_ID=MMETSP1443-20131203/58232_1 /TAXON_ID=186043 /ORGANISM="Entomoneis sp., Strain CCMP2396" /LENGTH=711 /DNA_ID=CAMNT_0043817915 /DNA_START=125 /DNA_END=2257 /DNA_ORIENTATION=-